MEINTKALAIVVTYNRIKDLKICVESLRNQSYHDLDILIINNGSTDNTKEWLQGQCDLKVINQNNVGGAGGFFAGMQYMYDHDYEWLVIMDDDGIADKYEIESLITSYKDISEKEGKDVILNALVVCKDDKAHTSFSWARGSERSNNISVLKEKRYFNDIHPFNGTLIKRDIISKIGLIKKEMFIWGDEKEYMARAVHNGIGLYTLTSAIHYHPKEKGVRGNIIPFVSKYKILLKPKAMSHYYYRNEGYIYNTYPEKEKNKSLFFMAYIIRFLTHFDFKELLKFVVYFNKGKHNQY